MLNLDQKSLSDPSASQGRISNEAHVDSFHFSDAIGHVRAEILGVETIAQIASDAAAAAPLI
jgi:hypothetical protein